MSGLNDLIAADAVNVFCSGNGFDETVTYTPRAPDVQNSARDIQAIVTRDPPAPPKANPNYTPPKMIIQVPNDAVKGISSQYLDTGGDTVTVAYRIGKTAQAFRIHIPDKGDWNDAGMLTLELR